MRVSQTLCALVIFTMAACSAGTQAPPMVDRAQTANTILPDLRLRPPVLRFSIENPKGKTEEVVGYEPGGSYHEDCSTLGVASISYESVHGHNAFFLVTPTHEGRCVIGFVHSGAKKGQNKIVTG